MQSMKWLALPALILASVVYAQKPADPKATPNSKAELQPPAKKLSLEELLASALQHSPEVQVAEAKLKEAEANLRQTRLQIAQKLIDLHTNSETQRKSLTYAEDEFKRMARLKEAGNVSIGEFADAERKLQALKGQIAQLEASVAAITGNLPALNRVEGNAAFNPVFRGHNLGGGGGVGLGGDSEGIQPRWPSQPMVEKLSKALDQNIPKVNKLENVPLRDLMEFVREQNKDIAILAKLDGMDEHPVTVNFKGELTFGNFLEMLMDTIPDLRIVVRDYGLLITMSTSMPDDGLSIVDFRQKRRQMQNQ